MRNLTVTPWWFDFNRLSTFLWRNTPIKPSLWAYRFLDTKLNSGAALSFSVVRTSGPPKSPWHASLVPLGNPANHGFIGIFPSLKAYLQVDRLTSGTPATCKWSGTPPPSLKVPQPVTSKGMPAATGSLTANGIALAVTERMIWWYIQHRYVVY